MCVILTFALPVETRRLYRLPSSAHAPPHIRHDSGDAGIGMGGIRVLGVSQVWLPGLVIDSGSRIAGRSTSGVVDAGSPVAASSFNVVTREGYELLNKSFFS